MTVTVGNTKLIFSEDAGMEKWHGVWHCHEEAGAHQSFRQVNMCC